MNTNKSGLLVLELISDLFVLSAYQYSAITEKENGRRQGSVALGVSKSKKMKMIQIVNIHHDIAIKPEILCKK